MWRRSLNYGLVPLMSLLKGTTIIRFASNLGDRLKTLNDSKQFQQALQLFHQHQKNNTEILSSLTITQALKACTHLRDIRSGKAIHDLVTSRTKDDQYIVTSLIHMYMQCGDVRSAETLFHGTKTKVPSVYGAMMKGYLTNNKAQKAFEVFHEIQTPSEVNLVVFFQVCADLKTQRALDALKKVLIKVENSLQSNYRLATSSVNALVKCGDVERAEKVFETIKGKQLPIYGAMMKGFIASNQAEKAVALFKQIKGPNDIIVNLLLNACAQLRTAEALALVKAVAKDEAKMLYKNAYLLTSLLNASMECGDVEHAEAIFNRINEKAVAAYGAMMKGYITNNQADKAIDLFKKIDHPDAIITNLLFNACAQIQTAEALSLVKQTYKNMPSSLYSNDYVTTSLLDALIKCKDTSTAKIVFSKMKRSVIDYANLMTGFNDQKEGKQTMESFYRMKREGLEPELITYLCVIKALALIGDLSLIEPTINQIPQSILLDTQIRNALIDMWGKTGCVDKAQDIYANISEPDAFTYTTMINSYGLNGMGMQALELFSQMRKQFIHEVTYICILNACSHSGLVDQARSIFQNIEPKTPTVWTTMIDCLARASLFDEAQTLIDEFERSHPPVVDMH
ncbi:unnamed protein product, partial [Adineta ricciae]